MALLLPLIFSDDPEQDLGAIAEMLRSNELPSRELLLELADLLDRRGSSEWQLVIQKRKSKRGRPAKFDLQEHTRILEIDKSYGDTKSKVSALIKAIGRPLSTRQAERLLSHARRTEAEYREACEEAYDINSEI